MNHGRHGKDGKGRRRRGGCDAYAGAEPWRSSSRVPDVVFTGVAVPKPRFLIGNQYTRINVPLE